MQSNTLASRHDSDAQSASLSHSDIASSDVAHASHDGQLLYEEAEQLPYSDQG